MRSDGGCHNIPATFTNTLPRLTNPPILRFQELDAINPGEDDGDDVDLHLCKVIMRKKMVMMMMMQTCSCEGI